MNYKSFLEKIVKFRPVSSAMKFKTFLSLRLIKLHYRTQSPLLVNPYTTSGDTRQIRTISQGFLCKSERNDKETNGTSISHFTFAIISIALPLQPNLILIYLLQNLQSENLDRIECCKLLDPSIKALNHFEFEMIFRISARTRIFQHQANLGNDPRKFRNLYFEIDF